MNVFELDQALVDDHQRFARSFTQIRAKDISTQVANLYSSNRFWPEPLISINPHFEQGTAIDKLVADGSLHPDTGKIFRAGGTPLRLHRHTGGRQGGAQEAGYVAQNVVRSVSNRKKKRTKAKQRRKLKVGVDIPQPAEVKAIIGKLEGRWRPLILTALFGGLRASELRGLRWQDVD